MNLAQLIDPERVRAEDPLAQRRSPMQPMGVVTHENGIVTIGAPALPRRPKSTGISDAVRAAVAGYREPFIPIGEIETALRGQYSTLAIRGATAALVQHGDLIRSGPRSASCYGLTQKGRAALPLASPP